MLRSLHQSATAKETKAIVLFPLENDTWRMAKMPRLVTFMPMFHFHDDEMCQYEDILLLGVDGNVDCDYTVSIGAWTGNAIVLARSL